MPRISRSYASPQPISITPARWTADGSLNALEDYGYRCLDATIYDRSIVMHWVLKRMLSSDVASLMTASACFQQGPVAPGKHGYYDSPSDEVRANGSGLGEPDGNSAIPHRCACAWCRRVLLSLHRSCTPPGAALHGHHGKTCCKARSRTDLRAPRANVRQVRPTREALRPMTRLSSGGFRRDSMTAAISARCSRRLAS